MTGHIYEEVIMPKYIIEREIPNAGNLTGIELQQISQKSCSILKEMGPQIEWIESYVTDDKVYCIYLAPNKESIKEHAEKGEFPANSIAEVKTMINPTTAEK
jgi:hypothetical protein